MGMKMRILRQAPSLRLLKEGFKPDIKVTKEHACPGCIFQSRTCGSAGPVDSPFIIVGESPGKQEALYQHPFIGESGELLKAMLYKAGFNDDMPQPYLTNAIKCLPTGKKDQSTTARACKACVSQLYQEIQAYPRKLILGLGAAAAWALTGDFRLKITQIRGTLYSTPLAELGALVTVHPAYLLRGGGSLNKFKSDLALAVEKLKDYERPQFKDSEHEVLHTVESFLAAMRRLDYTMWWHNSLGIEELPIGIDIETSGLSSLEDYILSLHFGWEDQYNYVVPGRVFQFDDNGWPTDPLYFFAVKQFLEVKHPKIKFVWHNGQFDIQWFWALGANARVDEDTMLLSYALDENPGLHDLEQVSNDAIGAPNWKSMLEQYLPNKNSSYALIPKHVLYKYGGKDVACTLQNYRVLKERVKADPHLIKAYSRVMIPAVKLLAKIESYGIWVDREQNLKNQQRLKPELDRIQKKLNELTIELCGETFNPMSYPQVAHLVYEVLKMPLIKGKGYSTDKEVLKALPPHPIVNLIAEYRFIRKQFGTYVINLVTRWDPKKRKWIKGHIKKDGRVHASYLIHGTVTGRLASRKPNMQNPPRDEEIRAQFAAPPGFVLIEVDLNQAELRSLAELSGDQTLINLYNDPMHPGLHHETSVAIFGPDYTHEDKMLAKAVNFGIVYGRTGASIAQAHDMPISEGEEWINRWGARFPIAWEFIQHCRQAPLDRLALVTCFGRKRRFSVVSRNNVHAVQNEASNFPHQSTASDITLVAHVDLIEDPRYKGNIVNLIHDAGLHEVEDDPDIIDRQTALITYYMEKTGREWGLTKVPFKAEAKIGRQWGKLKNYKVKNLITL